MKTRNNSLFFILSLVFLFKGMMMAQDPIKLFNEAFPEFENEIVFTPGIATLSPDEVASYRSVLKKLDDALDDLVAWDIKVLTDENAKVFRVKSLKK
jgi:hypothetical protein